MPNFIEIGGGSRKFSKKLVDLTRNDPIVPLDIALHDSSKLTGVNEHVIIEQHI